MNPNCVENAQITNFFFLPKNLKTAAVVLTSLSFGS